MIFGEVATADAVGALCVHTIRAGGRVIRKGAAITQDAADALASVGIATVIAARLEPGDVGEDEAAHRLASAVAGAGVRVEPPFTGRSNLFARHAGLLRIEAASVDRINRVDEAITLATLAAWKPVVEGEMIGTVKIIPYAVPEAALAAALAQAPAPAVEVAPYRTRRVGVISTLTPGFKPSIVAKTVGILAGRLAPAGAVIGDERTCPHRAGALTRALAAQAATDVEMLVVFGASAIADRRDVIPAALEAAGGEIVHFGMPVDPGNLLLLGRLGGRPVLGAPGCARSPVENGFDWILQRCLAGLEVTRADITGFGVGGLLMEVVARGQPRGGGEPVEEG